MVQIAPAGVTTVNYGGSQSYTITPDAGYHIADVLVDGSSVGAVTSYNFTNVTANHTISASFAINDYIQSQQQQEPMALSHLRGQQCLLRQQPELHNHT